MSNISPAVCPPVLQLFTVYYVQVSALHSRMHGRRRVSLIWL